MEMREEKIYIPEILKEEIIWKMTEYFQTSWSFRGDKIK
jgi:hypothetical protein